MINEPRSELVEFINYPWIFLGWEGYEDIFEIDEKHKNIKRSHFVLKVTTVDNEINRLKIGIL